MFKLIKSQVRHAGRMISGWGAIVAVIALSTALVVFPLWWVATNHPQLYTTVGLWIIAAIAVLLLLRWAVLTVKRSGIKRLIIVMMKFVLFWVFMLAIILLLLNRTLVTTLCAGALLLIMLVILLNAGKERMS